MGTVTVTVLACATATWDTVRKVSNLRPRFAQFPSSRARSSRSGYQLVTKSARTTATPSAVVVGVLVSLMGRKGSVLVVALTQAVDVSTILAKPLSSTVGHTASVSKRTTWARVSVTENGLEGTAKTTLVQETGRMDPRKMTVRCTDPASQMAIATPAVVHDVILAQHAS